jgi:hypothetical protein
MLTKMLHKGKTKVSLKRDLYDSKETLESDPYDSTETLKKCLRTGA